MSDEPRPSQSLAPAPADGRQAPVGPPPSPVAPAPAWPARPHGGATGATTAPVVSIGDWVLTFVILAIPLVNIIMALIWAFDSGTNPSKSNFFKAYLLLFAIIIGASLLFVAVMMGLGAVMHSTTSIQP